MNERGPRNTCTERETQRERHHTLSIVIRLAVPTRTHKVQRCRETQHHITDLTWPQREHTAPHLEKAPSSPMKKKQQPARNRTYNTRERVQSPQIESDSDVHARKRTQSPLSWRTRHEREVIGEPESVFTAIQKRKNRLGEEGGGKMACKAANAR